MAAGFYKPFVIGRPSVGRTVNVAAKQQSNGPGGPTFLTTVETNSLKPLAGQVALISNVDQGIGPAAALALASGGADLALTLDTARATQIVADLRALGVRVVSFSPPATVDDVIRMVRMIVSALGGIDIVVTNAERCVQGQLDDEELDEKEIEALFNVNVRAPICLIRSAAKVMRDGGRIVAVGASVADRVGTPGLSDFAATKAALTAFCKGAAHDLGPRGITVNVVQVGAMEVDFVSKDPELAAAERCANALKRLGQASEVANAILFLAGPGASFITGSVLNVDGGYNA